MSWKSGTVVNVHFQAQIWTPLVFQSLAERFVLGACATSGPTRKAAEIISASVRHSLQCVSVAVLVNDRRFTVRVFCVTIDRVLTSLARYGPENKTSLVKTDNAVRNIRSKTFAFPT